MRGLVILWRFGRRRDFVNEATATKNGKCQKHTHTDTTERKQKCCGIENILCPTQSVRPEKCPNEQTHDTPFLCIGYVSFGGAPQSMFRTTQIWVFIFFPRYAEGRSGRLGQFDVAKAFHSKQSLFIWHCQRNRHVQLFRIIVECVHCASPLNCPNVLCECLSQ